MITVKEIAKMCNVSPSTVSNILNGRPNVGQQTRQRVLDVIEETGYQPNYFASSMRKQNTRMISIVAEDLCRFSTASIADAAMAYCEEHGYRTMPMNLRMRDRRQGKRIDENKPQSLLSSVLKEVQSVKADGIVYVAEYCGTIGSFPEEFTLPAVIAYAASEKNRYPSVIIDDEKGGYDMVKYLISMGHEKIGIIAGRDGNAHTESRILGARRALQEAGIPYHSAWTLYGDWQRQSGCDCAEKLVKAGVTAIWCMNDAMAGGVYDYAHEHNIIIGKDISVAGYDNDEISQYMYPKLTTNELPLGEIGRKAAELLVNMLEGKPDPSKEPVGVPCRMMIRDSVCAVGNTAAF